MKKKYDKKTIETMVRIDIKEEEKIRRIKNLNLLGRILGLCA